MRLSYSEVSKLATLRERFDYLRLDGAVGHETFGSRRFMNQGFYASREWRQVRDFVRFRDNGCDLGVEGHTIFYRPLVHHINPLKIEDLLNGTPALLDPENLILTTHETHNAIHYGDARLLASEMVERSPNDHVEW